MNFVIVLLAVSFIILLAGGIATTLLAILQTGWEYFHWQELLIYNALLLGILYRSKE